MAATVATGGTTVGVGGELDTVPASADSGAPSPIVVASAAPPIVVPAGFNVPPLQALISAKRTSSPGTAARNLRRRAVIIVVNRPICVICRRQGAGAEARQPIPDTARAPRYLARGRTAWVVGPDGQPITA